MLGKISDEKANELIYVMSENYRKNMMGRSIVESQLFPVMHYIQVASLILYDQTFLYNISKAIAKIIAPEEIARRSKTLGSFLTQLAFNAYAMIYLGGRMICIYDNLEKRKHGDPNIEVESAEKRKEVKFILDFWRRLSPNYRNDGELTVEDGTIRFLPQDFIDTLRQEMVPVHNRPDLIKKIKRTSALITNRLFLGFAECRAGIFEHGPYKTESPDEVLIFKEFSSLYTGEIPFGLDAHLKDYQKTKAKSPIPNFIIGMTLKNMEKMQFNDWGTVFSEPADYSKNITSIGLWTKELIHPKDLRYPNNLGTIEKLDFEILDPLMEYAQESLTEVYIKIAKWDFLRRLMAGVNVYTNCYAVFALYAGLEKKWDWNWVDDVLLNQQRSDMVNIKDVKRYIEEFKNFPMDIHPVGGRFLRSKKKRRLDSSFYPLQD